MGQSFDGVNQSVQGLLGSINQIARSAGSNGKSSRIRTAISGRQHLQDTRCRIPQISASIAEVIQWATLSGIAQQGQQQSQAALNALLGMSGGYYTPTAAGPGEFSAAQKAQLISWFGGGASAGFGPAIINHPTRLTVGESGKEMVFTARAQGGFGIGDPWAGIGMPNAGFGLGNPAGIPNPLGPGSAPGGGYPGYPGYPPYQPPTIPPIIRPLLQW